MSDQLIFDWPPKEGLRAQDFFVAKPNERAVTMLSDTTAWPEQKLVLVGPQASGKSHLARIFAEETGAKIFSSSKIPKICEISEAVVVEDADRIPTDQQEALFHLHNNLRAAQIPLLLTSRLAPSRWYLSLPDLTSRMQATTIVRIEEPDDTVLQVLLTKHFADRQITPSASIINYIATRIDRSYIAASEIVVQLDHMSMSEKKPINMKIAARLLDK